MNTETRMYYSISEVAEMLGLEAYVLRFWEKEFPHLRPKKNRAGNRTYKHKDIEQLLQIKHLLYEKGFTIEGARNFLKDEGKKSPDKVKSEMAKKLISEVRQEIEDLLKLFP